MKVDFQFEGHPRRGRTGAAYQTGIHDQCRQLQERRWLRQVDEHRWLERFGHRIHPCAGAGEMGQLITRPGLRLGLWDFKDVQESRVLMQR